MAITVMERVFLIEPQAVTATERLVLLNLANHGHADGQGAFPGVHRITRQTSLSRRGAQKALRHLAVKGFIVAVGRGKRNTVDYVLNLAMLPEVPPRHRAPRSQSPSTDRERGAQTQAPDCEPRSQTTAVDCESGSQTDCEPHSQTQADCESGSHYCESGSQICEYGSPEPSYNRPLTKNDDVARARDTLLAHYAAHVTEHVGGKATPTVGDESVMAALLAEHGADEVRRALDALFVTADDFTRNTGFSLRLFAKQFDRYAARATAPVREERPPYVCPFHHEPPCRDYAVCSQRRREEQDATRAHPDDAAQVTHR